MGLGCASLNGGVLRLNIKLDSDSSSTIRPTHSGGPPKPSSSPPHPFFTFCSVSTLDRRSSLRLGYGAYFTSTALAFTPHNKETHSRFSSHSRTVNPPCPGLTIAGHHGGNFSHLH